MIAFLAGQDWWRRISFIAKVRQQTPPSILSSAATGTSNRLPMRIVGKLPSLAALYAPLRLIPRISAAFSILTVRRPVVLMFIAG